MNNEEVIRELKDHLEKLEAVTEFHVLSASRFIEEKYRVLKRIQELSNNEIDPLLN